MKLAAALLLAASTASADVDRVSILMGSEHVGMAYEFNETNPGLFLTWEDAIGSFDVTAGAYKNSYSDTSVSLTASYDVFEWGGGAIGLFAGAAYYGDAAKFSPVKSNGWVPIGGIQARFGNTFTQIIPMGGDDFVVSYGLTFEVD